LTAINEHTCYVLSEQKEQAAVNLLVARHLRDSDNKDTFDVQPPIVVMEVEDLAYHHSSSVTLPLLPAAPENDDSSEFFFEEGDYKQTLNSSHPDYYERMSQADYETPPEEEAYRRRRMLVLIATAYRFLELNEKYKLTVVGHTDTSGGNTVNFKLSDQRALNMLYLMQGKRAEWASNSNSTGKVEDYQLICKHYAQVFSWNCDPGDVDDKYGPLTQAAVQAFQTHYNEEFNTGIATDGIVGPVTWGAFFDAYMEELAQLLEISRDDLGRPRGQLRYVDEENPTIGCGERIPIDQPSRDNYRSEKNRRVELLFFHAEYLPDFVSHLEGGAIRSRKGGAEASYVYGQAKHRYRYIEPNWWEYEQPPKEYTPKLEIIESENDLGEYEDDLDSAEYDSEFDTLPVRKESEDDEWAFIEVMDALELGDVDWSGLIERDNEGIG
jgi:hypothetical protein